MARITRVGSVRRLLCIRHMLARFKRSFTGMLIAAAVTLHLPVLESSGDGLACAAAKTGPRRSSGVFDPTTRFISASALSRAYKAPPRTVTTSEGETLQIGVVDPADAPVALRISNVLSRSLEMARATRGGHIPDPVVSRVQRTIISPKGVRRNWADQGNRFVISRRSPRDPDEAEVLGTLIVARDHDTIFFLSGKHNNLAPVRDAAGKITHFVDDAGTRVDQQHVDEHVASFMPPLDRYKPQGRYQLANFAMVPEARGAGISRLVLDTVTDLIRSGAKGHDGEPLFPHAGGTGYWQIAEPPWQARMRSMHFSADPSQHVYMTPPRIGDKHRAVLRTAGLAHPQYNESWGAVKEYFVAMSLLLERGSDLDGRPIESSTLAEYREILSRPAMREVASRLASSQDEHERIRKDIERAGIAHSDRLPALYALAVEGQAKLQYKLLDAAFADLQAR